MFTIMKVALSAATALGISGAASATSVHRTHSHRTAVDDQVLPPKGYGSFAHCSPSSRTAFSRRQPGEAAIIIQDRGYREDTGLPFDAGECQ
jgi:hypothetical protein